MIPLLGLAANPALPLSDLEPLLHKGDLLTLVALAQRSDLTPTFAAALVESAAEDLARNPNAIAHVWAQLIAHPEPGVRCHLADNRGLPAQAQRALARDPDPLVRRSLALWRRDLPAEAVSLLAFDPDASVRKEIAWHRHRPAELLRDPDPQVRRNALRGGPPPEDLLAGLLTDPETRTEAAAHVTDPDRVATLVGDDDPGVREAAAGNHGVPFGLVRALAQDPDEEVRVAIMLRPDTPDEIRDAVTATVEPQDYHVADWLRPARATLAERLAQVGSRYVFFRRAIAFSRDLPTDAVVRLAADDDHSVRLLLAENSPDIPGEILPDLVRRGGHNRWDLVRHPNMPAQALAEFAASTDDDLRRIAATGPNLPPAVATALTTHPDHTTRHYVAANPALPLPILLELLHGPDLATAQAAAANPALPLATARQLLHSTG